MDAIVMVYEKYDEEEMRFNRIWWKFLKFYAYKMEWIYTAINF